MPTADLAPGQLDINCAQGDDVTLRCTFNIDLTGYVDWEALALPLGTTDVLEFDVDDSDQGNDIITLNLAGTDTATFSQARWDLKVTDPDAHVFYVLAGTINAQPTIVAP